jgi:hypothetical protein
MTRRESPKASASPSLPASRGLKSLRDKGDRMNSRFAFDRLREREGLGPHVINKTRVSRLLAILEHLREVEKWRAVALTDKQSFEWASPEAVHRHCPVFNPPVPTDPTAEPKPTKAQQTSLELATALEEIDDLKQKLKQTDGSLFDLKHDHAADIARTIAETIGETRWQSIRKAVDALYKARPRPAG